MIALLFDHLWQSSIFAGGAGLLTWALRRNSANVRFWLWFAASVKFLLPFAFLTMLSAHFLAPVTPPLHASALIVMQPVAQPFSGPDPALVLPGSAMTPAATHFDLTLVLLALWTAGFVAVSIRWFMRWSKLRLLLREAMDLRFTAPIAVKSSSSRIEPGLVGIFQPIILLPEGIERQLSAAEMNSIVAHELCHWRRRDNLLAAVHMLVEALFWFFPLVWWLGARLNAERERACDESVLATGNDPTIYAEGILKVCRLYLQSPLACAAGVSGAGLKKRIDVIMENRFLVRLDAFKKSLLATCAAAAIIAPVAIGLLTATPSVAPAIAQTTASPHPGTEAAVRHQIESMEKGQADYDAMVPALAKAARSQSARSQENIQKWGALKSITFRGNENGNDVYFVEFENQRTVWTIAPLQTDGKIVGLLIGLGFKRDGNGPSPGLEAAIRRELDGSLAGTPAFEIMSPDLQTATKQQWWNISTTAKDLGAIQTITFQQVNLRGWDVYHVIFANGTATVQAAPLTDGKLNGLLHTDIVLPHQPQHPGTEASLRRYIESLEKGQPNYDEMEPRMADVVKQELPAVLAQMKSWGALQSIVFKGGGPQGMDAYEVTFEHAKVAWNIGALDADGKVVQRGFHQIS